MHEEKIVIQNRNGQAIVGILTLPTKEGKWLFIIGCHGFMSDKNYFQEHWKKTLNLLIEEGYGYFLFDFTNNLWGKVLAI